MTATTETWNGLIKLKLVHRRGASVLLPDVLVGGSEHQHWIQPQYFYAPILALGEGLASFTLAALDPTGDDDAGHECHVRFSAGDLVAHFADGSLLYRCRVESQLDAVDLSIGQSRLGADNRLELLCFHHTSGESLNAIQSSATLRASSWNFQGTRRLDNVGYVYLTPLPKIREPRDLQRIAMASEGRLGLRVDQNDRPSPDVVLEVYRESTSNRQHTLALWMQADLISSGHVWQHIGTPTTFYEFAHPWIVRVGLKPGAELGFADGVAAAEAADVRTFDYVVIGRCTTPAGLVAPYDEENTSETFVVQRLDGDDLFAFWQREANQPLFRPPVDLQSFKQE